MPKPSITEATNINAEVVLDLGKFYSAKELRGLQSKLTGTAREIRELTNGSKLLGRIGGKLTNEQLQLLRNAAKLIESVGFNVEHAKEKRHRGEVVDKTLQKDRDNAARKLVASTFPLPGETLEQKLDIIRLAIVLNRAGCFQPFYSPTELSLRLRNYVTDNIKPEGWADSTVKLFRNFLLSDLEQYVSVMDSQTVHERMGTLLLQVEKLYPEFLQDTYEIETLRLWSEALCSSEQEDDQ